MYIIEKTVHGNKYWYNQWKKHWEGLRDNATLMTEADFTAIWNRFTVFEKEQMKFEIFSRQF